MTTLRTTAWENRTLWFPELRLPDGTLSPAREISGWEERNGGGTSVATSKYSPSDRQGDITVASRVKTTDNVTLKGAFPVAQEQEVSDFLLSRVGKKCEYFNLKLDPETEDEAGTDIYVGILEKVMIPEGGAGDSTDVAKYEITLSVNGRVA